MNITPQKKLELLSEIISISNSTLNIDSRLESILEIISSSLSLKGIALYVIDAGKEILSLKTSKNCDFKSTIPVDVPPFDILIKEKKHYIFNNNDNNVLFLSRSFKLKFFQSTVPVPVLLGVVVADIR